MYLKFSPFFTAERGAVAGGVDAFQIHFRFLPSREPFN